MKKVLDPQAQALLDAAAAAQLPPVYRVPTAEARRRMHAAFTAGEPEPIAVQRDLVIPGPAGGIPLRLYRDTPHARQPVILFFHGGGWTVNDLDTHDRLCSLIAKGSGATVVSVDYRRSPEHKYPAAVEDAYTALQWVVTNDGEVAIDRRRVAVVGDSSGATLAATTCLLARDRRGPQISYQVLLYPVTDYVRPESLSYSERASGYSLDREFMEWAWRNYLPALWDREDPYLFPLRASLQGLPPALVLTAEFDPLRDDGLQFAEQLRDSGVDVEHVHFDDQMHGFAMQTRTIARAKEAVDRMASKIRHMLEGQS
jgi:acetyl esterase